MNSSVEIICPPDLSTRPLDLRIEKLIALPAGKVFDAWTTRLDLWFASPGSWISRIEPNAPFFFETFFHGTRNPHYGRFLQLVPNSLIQLTWLSEATSGAETVLTVALSPVGEQTHLTLTQEGFADETSRQTHEDAWPAVLDQLYERMSRPAD